MTQIANAMNSGKSAATMDIVAPIAAVATLGAIALDILAACFGIDVMAEIKEWVMKRFEAAKKKFAGGPPDENSKVGKFLKAIKAMYQKIMGWVNNIKEWIQMAIAWVNKQIAWVDAKIKIITDALNTPCARKALGAMSPEVQAGVNV